MKSFLDRLHERFVIRNVYDSLLTADVEGWLAYIRQLGEPKDVYETAYYKYKCRMKLFPAYKKIIFNALGLFAIFVEIPFLLLSNKHLKKPEDKKTVLEIARDVPEYKEVAPPEIFNTNNDLLVIPNINKKFGVLCSEARKLLINTIIRYPTEPFFIYWVYMELVTHSEILLKYNPLVTYVYVNERNVASAIITQLYEENGREFASFMHGEYPLQLIHAFSSFSTYYVWNEHYIDICRNYLNCNTGRYVVYTPLKLSKYSKLVNISPEYDVTYYFSGESEESLAELKRIFDLLARKGLKCKCRIHPRDPEWETEMVCRLFEDYKIENPYETDMMDSLSSTKYVIGLATTVLSEAAFAGREIIIDDISKPVEYANLDKQKYPVFSHQHILLSDFIKNKLG